MFKSHTPHFFKRLLDRLFRRNKTDNAALQGVGEQLHMAASTPLMPIDNAFKASLLAKLKENRQVTPTSMFDQFAQRFQSLVRVPRFQAVVAMVLIVAIVVTTSRYYGGGKYGSLLISPAYAQDNFSVTATAADSTGVETNTQFTVTSKMAINKNDLQKNLTLIPSVPFEVKQVNEHQFTVIPKQALEPKTIYKVYINSAYTAQNGATVDRDYSWAFQVKNIFKIVGSIPGDKTNRVPVNSGIEVSFSHDKVTNFNTNFHIQPAVEGRFETHGRVMVFVPKALQPGTIYTVTVGKNVGIENASQHLAADYTFSFETESASNTAPSYSGINFDKTMSEFSSAVAPALSVYVYASESNAHVEAYRITSAEDFVGAMQKQDAVPTWATASRQGARIPTANLTRAVSFDATAQSYGYNRYMVFPNPLPVGYYVVNLSINGQLYDQTLMQVSNISAYTLETKTNTLVWVNSLSTKQPVSGAAVRVMATGVNAVTNAQGVATFDTVTAFTVRDVSVENRYVLVSTPSGSLVVKANSLDSSFARPAMAASSVVEYLYTDRHMYLPNDTVKIWGYIGDPKAGTHFATGTIELGGMSGEYNMYGDPVVRYRSPVTFNADGTFTALIPLKQYLPSSYLISINAGGSTVGSTYISVQPYVKPAYQLSLTANKHAVYVGETVTYAVKAAFFDGTPVGKLDLQYALSGSGTQGKITTNDNGEATFSLTAENNSYCRSLETCSYPQSMSVNVSPVMGEEGNISTWEQVSVFGPTVLNQTKVTQTSATNAQVSVSVRNIDTAAINNGDTYARYVGKPAAGSAVRGTVVEVTYVPRETGQYYNFIDKKTYKTYEYDQVENQIATFNGVTNADGIFTYGVATQPDRSYRIETYASDPQGKTSYDLYWIYTRANTYRYTDNENYYTLKVDLTTTTTPIPFFRLNETVQAHYQQNNETMRPGTGSYLFYTSQLGLMDYAVQADPNFAFTFQPKHIPSIALTGVWFDGVSYHVAAIGNSWDSYIRYDSSERALNIQVQTDKVSYQPGEQVNISARVTDTQGNPVRSSLNFNLVDEAYYALSYEVADPLSALYKPVDPGILFVYSSHEAMELTSGGGAEGGGCFAAGTKVRMADGSEKNIEDVKSGDAVLTFEDEYTYRLVPALVVGTVRHTVDDIFVINHTLRVTPEHRIFVNHTWRPIGDAKVGDYLLGADGNKIRIDSIERKRERTLVYNLHVQDKHTYIADGIYVHNDKGGDRSNFADVAGFVTMATNQNGEAKTTITLPDNITSWRITTQALAGNGTLAGASTKNVPVSKPLFVESTFAPEYILGDKPIIKARAYGQGVQSGSAVNFTFSAPKLGGVTSTAAGKAYEPSYFPLPNLKLGTYPVRVAVTKGNLTDAVVKPLTVIASRASERTDTLLTATNNMRMPAISGREATVQFMDLGQAQFVQTLYDLSWQYSSDRTDETIARIESNQLLQNTFHQDVWSAESFEPSQYQNNDGGFGLLPYGSSDTQLSALIAAATPEYADQTALAGYFGLIVGARDVSIDELVNAYLGLASLGEPALPELQALTTVKDLSPLNQLKLAWGLQKMGDTERARKIYNNAITAYGQAIAPDYRLYVDNKNDDVNTELTMIAAIVGTTLRDDHARGLWNYAKQHPTRDILLALQKIAYVRAALPTLVPGEASAVMHLNNIATPIKLQSGYPISVSVSAEELKTFTLSDVKGAMGIMLRYNTPVTNRQSSPGLSITRAYYVRGNRTTSFAENDLVQIVLNKRVSSNSAASNYLITDYLPSGLKLISSLFNPYTSQYTSERACYPYAVEGQAVKFMVGTYANLECNDTITYYARVVNRGTYTAESPELQDGNHAKLRAFGTSETVEIK